MIRQARMSDLDQALRLFEEGYAETPFSKMEYNESTVRRWFANAVTFEEKFFCRVVENDGELVGILIGFSDANFWGVPTAQTLVSYSRTDTTDDSPSRGG